MIYNLSLLRKWGEPKYHLEFAYPNIGGKAPSLHSIIRNQGHKIPSDQVRITDKASAWFTRGTRQVAHNYNKDLQEHINNLLSQIVIFLAPLLL